jgi:hypothetical protein
LEKRNKNKKERREEIRGKKKTENKEKRKGSINERLYTLTYCVCIVISN